MQHKSSLTCFKAYDIRGMVPQELNDQVVFFIGKAYVDVLKASKVVVGYDVRLESFSLSRALIAGLKNAGADVLEIGLCGTEEVYFHTFNLEEQGVDGGIMVTASHNPKGYNGMKMVTKGSRPVFSETGLQGIKERAQYYLNKNEPCDLTKNNDGVLIADCRKSYIDHLLSYINLKDLKPLKILVNPGNGPAGLIVKEIEKHLPFNFIYLNDEPDGHFPNGVPNPLLVENRFVTQEAVIKSGADFGLAWDGDFDRCFFFDEKGEFIEGYYIVGLLAEFFLKNNPDSKIIHDPRLTWNTIDIVKKNRGIPVQSKTGHAFIKDRMRSERAIYGGEMSAHHYFKEFAYCDSGMIPWLIVTELLSARNCLLSEMIADRVSLYPCSGEINYKVENSQQVVQKIVDYFSLEKPMPIIDKTDGVSLAFDKWRFNIRMSNTEPLLRLNIETLNDLNLLKEKERHIDSIVKLYGIKK